LGAPPAAHGGVATSGVIYQDAPHGLCGDGEEVSTILRGFFFDR
jgi:hypothetical protein